jgi:hypothetical protein
MSFEIIISQFAELELKQAVNYYNGKKPGLGDEFVAELDYIFEKIQKNPGMFPKVIERTQKAVLKRFPFNVYFIVVDTRVFITAIFNTWREPKIWRDRKI